jgi:hypothetical protein
MTATLDDLAAYLATQCSWVAGTDLFGGTMPSTPDTLTALYDTAHGGPIETLGAASTPAIINPGLQVQTRALDYATARTRCRAAYNALVLIVNTTVGGSYYERVVPIQEPFLFHNDESNRTLFACNFDVFRSAE